MSEFTRHPIIERLSEEASADFIQAADWTSCYEVRHLLSLASPCGAWVRACESAAPRQRLLTMASCRPRERVVGGLLA